MTHEIDIAPEGTGLYRVEVHGPTRTTHTVRLTPDMVADLGWSGPETELLRESFVFLLEREPQTSILRSFDLEVIGRYFPEYPDEIRRRTPPEKGQSS